MHQLILAVRFHLDLRFLRGFFFPSTSNALFIAWKSNETSREQMQFYLIFFSLFSFSMHYVAELRTYLKEEGTLCGGQGEGFDGLAGCLWAVKAFWQKAF